MTLTRLDTMVTITPVAIIAIRVINYRNIRVVVEIDESVGVASYINKLEFLTTIDNELYYEKEL